MSMVGYVNPKALESVSSQTRKVKSAGCKKVAEGGLKVLLEGCGDGDVVAVSSLSVLGKSAEAAIGVALSIHDAGHEMVFADEGIDTTMPQHAAFFEHIGAVAGIAKRERQHTGGKPKVSASDIARAVGMYQSGKHIVPEIVAKTGVSKSTLYRNIGKPGAGDS